MTSPLPALRTFERRGILRRRLQRTAAIPFVVRCLDLSALADVRRIHHEALRSAPGPGVVRVDADEFFAHHLNGDGLTLGVFAEDRLVAYAILGLPEAAAYPYDHFGSDLGLPTAAAFQIAQLIGVGVLPEWRGNQLHRQLSGWRLELARAAGKQHAAAVASPRNPFSWRNLLAVGLRIKGFKLLPGNALRYLFHTTLQSPPAPDWTTAVTIPAADTDAQQNLLRQGYWGYAAATDHAIPHVRYARPRSP